MYTQSDFEAPWWLGNRHAQTVFPSTRLCKVQSPIYRRERIELPDGDFVEADWVGDYKDMGRPILVLLHGLEGSSESSYARMMMNAALEAGWAGIVLHFRGCGGSSNRLPRRYHAGDTGDVDFFVRRLRERFPGRTILGIGYSLGGNVLMKYLGETGPTEMFDAAIAVSVPYDLHNSAEALALNGSRIYQRFLLGNMRRSMAAKYTPELSPFNWQRAMKAQTFYEFDGIVTAPLHGFRDADDYYNHSSSGQYLRGIQIPTLLLGAYDDPFMTRAAYPTTDVLPKNVQNHFSENGGHVGFIYGRHPWQPRYWLPQRAMGYFVDELGIARKN